MVYTAERPVGCTNFYTSPTVGPNILNGDGYIILLQPTGPLPLCPQWQDAQNLLETEIQNFQNYLQDVDLPCECREYLHIIGFSDGASTVGGWLNDGAGNTQAGDDHYGVVALIDVIRKFNTDQENLCDNATWTVNAMPAGRLVVEYAAFRNKSGGFLQNCDIRTADWAGHQILTTPTPWSDSGLINNSPRTCHTDFPEDDDVEPNLIASIQSATMTLIDNDLAVGRCNCISVNACPDLNGDGDVDLNDWEIMQGLVAGPTSGSRVLGPTPGDIDLDGDVDLRDLGFFQQAFSVPSP